MAKIMCSLDTDTGDYTVSHDSNMVDCHSFTMGSYFDQTSSPGDDIPQWCYFSYAKTMPDGTNHQVHGSFDKKKKAMAMIQSSENLSIQASKIDQNIRAASCLKDMFAKKNGL